MSYGSPFRSRFLPSAYFSLHGACFVLSEVRAAGSGVRNPFCGVPASCCSPFWAESCFCGDLPGHQAPDGKAGCKMTPAVEINRIIVRQLERHKLEYECDFDLMLEVGCLCAVVFRGLAECQKHGEEI